MRGGEGRPTVVGLSFVGDDARGVLLLFSRGLEGEGSPGPRLFDFFEGLFFFLG